MTDDVGLNCRSGSTTQAESLVLAVTRREVALLQVCTLEGAVPVQLHKTACAVLHIA